MYPYYQVKSLPCFYLPKSKTIKPGPFADIVTKFLFPINFLFTPADCTSTLSSVFVTLKKSDMQFKTYRAEKNAKNILCILKIFKWDSATR